MRALKKNPTSQTEGVRGARRSPLTTYVAPEESMAVKRIAAALGRTESDLVRDALFCYLGALLADLEEDARAQG